MYTTGSQRGNREVILAAATPATSSTELTAFKAFGNSCRLLVTTVTGGAGTLTLTLEESEDNGTTYYQCDDLDSAATWTSTTINTAGTYSIPITYPFMVNNLYRFSYSCTSAAGTIAIVAISYENPAGSSSVSVGDINADFEALRKTPTVTPATGSAAINTSTALAADFQLDSITLHLSAAPTTSEELLVTLDAGAGAAYDTVLARINLASLSSADFVITPEAYEFEKLFSSTDKITVTYTNTDTVTYGLRIVTTAV
jgi:hypothetical protein